MTITGPDVPGRKERGTPTLSIHEAGRLSAGKRRAMKDKIGKNLQGEGKGKGC